MKNAILILSLMASTTVFASTMSNIKTLSNKTLEKSAKTISKFDFINGAAYKKVINLKSSGKTEQEKRQKTIEQALHSVCGFFDEGVSTGLNSADLKGSKDAASEFLDNSSVEDSVSTALENAISEVNGKNGVEVYSGSASGNNTMGTVLGFYDTKNNELAVFANTNCGSDD